MQAICQFSPENLPDSTLHMVYFTLTVIKTKVKFLKNLAISNIVADGNQAFFKSIEIKKNALVFVNFQRCLVSFDTRCFSFR